MQVDKFLSKFKLFYKPILSIIKGFAFLQFARIVVMFLSAKMLSVNDFGVLGIITVIASYIIYVTLGVSDAMVLELPLLDKEHDDKRNKIVQTALSFTIIVGSFCFIVCIIVPFYLQTIYNYTFILASFYFFCILLNRHALSYCQATQNYELQRKLNIISGGILLVVSPVSLNFFGLNGLLAAMAISTVLPVIIYRCDCKITLGYNLELNQLVALIKVGLPLVIGFLCAEAYLTSDRWFVLKYYGIDSVGYYALAASIFRLITLIPGMAGQVLYPVMAKEVSNKNMGEFKKLRHVYKISVIFITSVVCMVGLLCILNIRSLLPKYESGHYVYLITIITGFVYSYCQCYVNLIYAFGKKALIALLQPIVLLIDLIVIHLSIIFIQQSYSVAIGLSITLIIFFIILFHVERILKLRFYTACQV